MPQLPSQYNGTWIQSAYNNYATDGTLTKVKQLIDMAVNFKTSRNVPVYCGEFGVFMPNSDPVERATWYEEVRKYLDEQEIPWTIWDYTGGFGVFEAGSNELFEHDLNVPMLQALDFNAPPQTNFYNQPKTSSLIIYDDYPAPGIITSSYGGTSTITYYDTNDPQSGIYAIQWQDGELYEAISFDFRPDVNLSLLPGNDYYLNFWVRGGTSGLSFDIRFVDTKTGSNDHPWRMGKTIDETITTWNGDWQLVSIPLDEMEEKGSWDNGWYAPEGKFSWSAVDRLEIVAEHMPLNDVDIFFDNIQITGPEIEIVSEVEANTDSKSMRAYPNPVEGHCLIEYTTQTTQQINISILDQFGRPLRHLFEGVVLPGTHIWTWYGDTDLKDRVANGVYIAVIQDDKTLHASRLSVLH
jgi:endoglucanase